jgi:hypothetical protein
MCPQEIGQNCPPAERCTCFNSFLILPEFRPRAQSQHNQIRLELVLNLIAIVHNFVISAFSEHFTNMATKRMISRYFCIKIYK